LGEDLFVRRVVFIKLDDHRMFAGGSEWLDLGRRFGGVVGVSVEGHG
jgi:hypothetical protein